MARNILGEWANGTRDLIGDRVIQRKHTVYGVQIYGFLPTPILNTPVQEGENIRVSWTYP